jgi:PAS domain S-box-containing protein
MQFATVLEKTAFLTAIADIQKNRIEEGVQSYLQLVELVQSDPAIHELLQVYLPNHDPIARNRMRTTLFATKNVIDEIERISILDTAGKVVASTDTDYEDTSTEVQDFPNSPTLTGLLKDGQNRLIVRLIGPLVSEGKPIGLVEIHASATLLVQITSDRSGMGDSGETILAEKNDFGDALFLTPVLFDSSAALKRTVKKEQVDVPIFLALDEKEAVLFTDFVDYRGIPAIAATRFIQSTGWGLVVKIDKQEAFARLYKVQFALVVFTLLSTVALALVSLAFTQLLLYPLVGLEQTIEKMSKGNLSERALVDSNDEIGQLATSFNGMASELEELYRNMENEVQKRTGELGRKVEELEQSKKAMLNVMEDLDDAKKAVEQEIESTRKFQQAVESSSDGILITDKDGVILYVNSAWEKLTGYSKNEALGRKSSIQKSPNTPAGVYEKLWKTISLGKPFHSDEIINTRKNGREYNAELKVYPVQSDAGDIVFYVGAQQDITSRKREEQAKSEFASLVSHQLRTPLTGIRWTMNRLRKNKEHLPKKMCPLVDSGYAAVLRMNETIRAMLNIARIEGGSINPTYRTVKIQPFLKKLLKECATAKNALQTSLSVPKNLSLQTDPSILEQIVSNLLSNAVKYTPDNGKVSVDVSTEQDMLRIDVTDTGFGIPAHQQKNIFSKFFRAVNASDQMPDGNGLGLYLVKQLSKILGGSVSFVSVEGKGSTFSIFLPLTPPNHA